MPIGYEPTALPLSYRAVNVVTETLKVVRKRYSPLDISPSFSVNDLEPKLFHMLVGS